jgi:hypothetical protein
MSKAAALICLLMAAPALFAAGCVGEPADPASSFEPEAGGDVAESAGDLAAAANNCQKRGMTWKWHYRTVDVDSVGYDDDTRPYTGDTACNTSLPLLCIRKTGNGLPVPSYIDTTNPYNAWSGGYIALSRAHVGYDMSSQAAANAICASELGSDWRMAEFHDGWGWDFQAYGAATHPERFWVAISDQPANCWNSSCESAQ